MSVELNHTIVAARDRRNSDFLAKVLGLVAPTPFGPFMVVEIANGVSSTSPMLDYWTCHATIGVGELPR